MSAHFKKCTAFLLAAALACVMFSVIGAVRRAHAFTGSAESMIVIERDTGRVLNEKNADKRRPMAS